MGIDLYWRLQEQRAASAIYICCMAIIQVCLFRHMMEGSGSYLLLSEVAAPFKTALSFSTTMAPYHYDGICAMVMLSDSEAVCRFVKLSIQLGTDGRGF